MSVPKLLDFENYKKYPNDPNPTTDAQMQDYLTNQNVILSNVSKNLWQPKTSYLAGDEIKSPNIPNSSWCAICTVAGQSGVTEPSWNNTNETYNDGGVVWKISKGKLDKNQGSANAGKMLQVNASGMLELVNDIMPTGVVLPLAGNGRRPNGWLLCDGANYHKDDYPALFSLIGQIYGGEGDYFKVPNLVGRFIEGGEEAGNVIEAGLPAPTIMSTVRNGTNEIARDYGKSGTNVMMSNTNNVIELEDFKLDIKEDNVYGKSTTVQPPAITMRYIIKY